MVNIVFCATQRTGSSVVVDDFCNMLGTAPIDAENLTTILFRRRTATNWNEVWDQHIRSNTVRDITITKLMYHYSGYVADCICGTLPPANIEAILDFDANRLSPLKDFFSSAVWVHIKRQDVVSQAVSVFLARETDIWENRPADGALLSFSLPEYNKETLCYILNELTVETKQWQKFFDHFAILPIEIEYESIFQEYPRYLSPVWQRLNIEPIDQVPERRMQKLGSDINLLYAERLRHDFQQQG